MQKEERKSLGGEKLGRGKEATPFDTIEKEGREKENPLGQHKIWSPNFGEKVGGDWTERKLSFFSSNISCPLQLVP